LFFFFREVCLFVILIFRLNRLSDNNSSNSNKQPYEYTTKLRYITIYCLIFFIIYVCNMLFLHPLALSK
jgi:hypothetical protein